MIWQSVPGSAEPWRQLAPVGFPSEVTLHTLVEQSPNLLPLSGEPTIIVLGSEVILPTGSADILAVEPDGRLVVIEVKLANNAEARRAVVAQVLAYAAVEPEKKELSLQSREPAARPSPVSTFAGSEEFERRIPDAPPGNADFLKRFVAFARSLEARGTARVQCRVGGSNVSLVPIVVGYDSGLCAAYLSSLPTVHRTVFERRAPAAWSRIGPLMPPSRTQQQFSLPVDQWTDEFFAMLLEAYDEASGDKRRGG